MKNSYFSLKNACCIQGAGREVVAHLVQASELVANLTKWRTRRDFSKTGERDKNYINIVTKALFTCFF
jgi:hypothetical protein